MSMVDFVAEYKEAKAVADKEARNWMETAWQYVLCLDDAPCPGANSAWPDYPAMMTLPISSPAGRRKDSRNL